MRNTAIASREGGCPEVEGGSRPRSSAAAAAEDTAFCIAVLPRVSRTFALSIEALPGTLRAAVRVAYLLCRVVDSIEDAPGLGRAQRNGLFNVFDSVLDDDQAEVTELEVGCRRAAVGGTSADGELCRGAGAVVRAFRALPEAQREATRAPVLEMSAGMRAYAARGAVLRLADLEDLERYCYFVAGTVGNLLTGLFEQTMPGLPDQNRFALRDRAVSFGLGLQMVNVVKDVTEDFTERGACFLPLALAREHGLDLERLLDPEMRESGLAVIRAVCKRARAHLGRAEEYVSLWPAAGEGGEAGRAIRLFCAVPLALALATLRLVEEGESTLRRGAEPKVSRRAVAGILAEASLASASDQALAALLGRARG
ncbi:MAG: squalene/phytoene synthase family protein [Polyangia bacterium]